MAKTAEKNQSVKTKPKAKTKKKKVQRKAPISVVSSESVELPEQQIEDNGQGETLAVSLHEAPVHIGKNGHKKDRRKLKGLVLVRTHHDHTYDTIFEPKDQAAKRDGRIRRIGGKPILLLRNDNGASSPLAIMPIPKEQNITPDELYAMQNWRERTRWQRKKPTRWQQMKTMAMLGLFAIMIIGIFIIGATVFSD
jgi:hypothetical protein